MNERNPPTDWTRYFVDEGTMLAGRYYDQQVLMPREDAELFARVFFEDTPILAGGGRARVTSALFERAKPASIDGDPRPADTRVTTSLLGVTEYRAQDMIEMAEENRARVSTVLITDDKMAPIVADTNPGMAPNTDYPDPKGGPPVEASMRKLFPDLAKVSALAREIILHDGPSESLVDDRQVLAGEIERLVEINDQVFGYAALIHDQIVRGLGRASRLLHDARGDADEAQKRIIELIASAQKF